MTNILSKLLWPLQKLSQDVAEQVAEKARVATRAALAEAPILDDLFDGKPVDLVMTIQLKRKV